jgi:hypothetical protein
MSGQDSLFSFITPNIQLQKNKNNIQELIPADENNPLFEHLLSHIKTHLQKNTNDKKTVQCLSGFIKNELDNKILKEIIRNGIPEQLPCLRALLWKTMIGYLPINDLSQWKKITLESYKNYNSLKKEFQDFENNTKDEGDRRIINQINLDLPRTRSEIPFFREKSKISKNETNYDVLRRILYIYAKKHIDVSYVQGMNEIVAIIYYIYNLDENPYIKPFIESDTYYSFEALLEDMKLIFMMDNENYSKLTIAIQIKEINQILTNVEPDLIKYFKNIDLVIDNFIMRWMFVMFAQNFTLQTSISFWDRILTQKHKMNFLCFISSTILIINKKQLMRMEMENIIEWAQNIGNIVDDKNIGEIVTRAFEIKKKYKKKNKKFGFTFFDFFK